MNPNLNLNKVSDLSAILIIRGIAQNGWCHLKPLSSVRNDFNNNISAFFIRSFEISFKLK